MHHQLLGTLDWIVVVLYFLLIAGISAWTMRRKKDTSGEYFLAGRNIGWFIIGTSILASNIGSEHVVGLAGTAVRSGVVMGQYELQSYVLLLLGWVFIPFYMRSKVFTMPEFLERRFNAHARWFLSVVSLLSYVLTKVSVTVYAGSVVISSFIGVDFWTSAIMLVVITGIYTILGGMRAVAFTEALQAIVLLLGSLTLTLVGLHKLGGWNTLIDLTPKSQLNLFRPLSDPDFPWAGLVFAAPIVGIWYWCTDQYIVQHCLMARNEQQARRGAIFGGYLKLFPFFIFMIPGLIAAGLARSGQIQLQNPDQAFPVLVEALLPAGIRGLVAGGLLAALMSSLASVFNSCSTLFTMDIYKKIKPDTSEKNLVRIGRLATAVVVALGILWVPLMKGISGVLYQYLQSVQSYLAPPIAAVFLLGLLYKRINASGALTALIGGFILGILRIILELNKSSLSGFLYTFADINFLYFCLLLFVTCVLLMIGVSLLTARPSEAQLNGLTFATTLKEDKASSRASWNRWDVWLSVAILIILAVVYVYFSKWGVAG